MSSNAAASTSPAGPGERGPRPGAVGTESAAVSRWRAAISANVCGAVASCSSGRRTAVDCATKAAAASSSRSARHARIGAVQIGRFPALELREGSSRNVVNARCNPSVPARGRGPRKTARSRVSIAAVCAPRCAFSRSSGMFQQAEERYRRDPAKSRIHHQPGEYAGRRRGQRVAADRRRALPARQRRQHATRQGASA